MSLLRGRRRFMCDAKCKHTFNLVVLKNVPTYVFIYFLHTVKSPMSRTPTESGSAADSYNKCYANRRDFKFQRDVHISTISVYRIRQRCGLTTARIHYYYYYYYYCYYGYYGYCVRGANHSDE